jgi:hypothetical protein
MAAPLSSDPLNVAARTLTGSNPSHSLKVAEAAARCAHTCQGSKPAGEASGGFWRMISGAYGLRKNRSRPNSRHQLARTSGHQLARTSEHQLARESEHHKPKPLGLLSKPSTSKGEELAQAGEGEELAQASKGEELARQGRHHKPWHTSEHHLHWHTSEHHKPWRTSRHHTRPARVGITNLGAQFFILKVANPRMIRGFYGAQFFISEKLMNGKRIVQMYYYAGRRIAAWTSLDTTLAGP